MRKWIARRRAALCAPRHPAEDVAYATALMLWSWSVPRSSDWLITAACIALALCFISRAVLLFGLGPHRLPNLEDPPMTDSQLTPAEQAAAEAIKAAYARAGWRMPDDFDDEARAVVAAVQNTIAAETLRELATRLRRDVEAEVYAEVEDTGMKLAAAIADEAAADRQAEGSGT